MLGSSDKDFKTVLLKTYFNQQLWTYGRKFKKKLQSLIKEIESITKENIKNHIEVLELKNTKTEIKTHSVNDSSRRMEMAQEKIS